MFKTFVNIFRVPELRSKVLFTLFMLAIFRIGYHVPLPGVDQAAMEAHAQRQKEGDSGSPIDRLATYVMIFSGGDLTQSTIFGLGIMPYISASIIFQLLMTVVPALEKLKKEGETGRRKIQEWTRYATVPLAFLQAVFWLGHIQSSRMVMSEFAGTFLFWSMGVTCLVAGCIFLMWLGEQIDEYGVGSGISLIILAGIVARMPSALGILIGQSTLSLGSTDPTKDINLGKVIFLIASFVFVTAGAILITQAQRRIPIQQAKQTRGRRVYGGARQYLPLRVNHGGVMPIIFAQSLMLLPSMLFPAVQQAAAADTWFGQALGFLASQFTPGHYLYVMCEVAMIFFFSYFWTTVQFQPKEMANQLRDYGSFIPGLRPGKRTSEYLERVMTRITYVGAAFLCVIAVVPTAVSTYLQIPYQVTAFLGGTGLLIVVSVSLDIVSRIEANLLMRNYGGFLGGTSRGIKGARR